MDRKRKLLWNTISSLLFQITSIVCGFILPRLILGKFGSDVNGLVNSISQFLHIITFTELGVGAVVESTLYKPLAEKNDVQTSRIIVSADKFFNLVGLILLAYVIVLSIFYPFIGKHNFGWLYSAVLVVTISVSTFAQFYFGVVDRLLLTADQRGFVQYSAQIITLILNTIVCALLIHLDCSIHVVKISTSLIYLIRPVFLRIYVRKHYRIDRKMKLTEEPIKQKWNGIAQHTASVVLDQTDTIVLTIFSTLSNVSIYSVYHLVIYGLKQLFLSTTAGIRALIGELWAKQELEKLNNLFGYLEWIIHTITVLLFCCAGVLMIPFVSVYTNGITDANYVQPLFSILIVTAHAGHCLRMPYNTMILAAGHYKQTQNNYIIAALLNILISIVTVKMWGLIGVAIGTLVAMAYQTVWMALYISKNIIMWPFKSFIKRLAVDVVEVVCVLISTYFYKSSVLDYFHWVILAAEVFFTAFAVIFVINYLFYPDLVKQLIRKLNTRLLRNKQNC